ncbi:serine/threonine protein kinase [Solihabitans fulvus]|uniref:non-specific serine/threonine protein kinase n=2 Tax=Solihabitans fulvus TaxID=1892852 RepID=A0A5B2X660_9PSEU|nr:serine/threonine protein kinase [Solihabitans fulvus]
MGVVWRAEDQVIGRQVAIKELRLPADVPPEERAVFEQRVLREARTAGRLNDPAVVTVFDVVAEDGTSYIVMELVEAPTLSDEVTRRGPLPPERVAAIAGQLLSALEAAHTAGVVHRDVKPGNIMVLPNGRVKLADFGIAQAVDDPRLTTSGTLIGSPAFMAPERVHGHEAGPPSDLWALGATLFFAVEGFIPFERSSTAATLHAIINEVPFLTRCQGPLASAISGLLIASPAARLSTAQVRALLDQVAPSAAGVTAPIAPPTARYPYPQATVQVRPPAPARRRRWGVTIPVTLVLVAALLTAGVLADRYVLNRPDTPVSAMQPTWTYGEGGQLPAFGLSKSYCANGRLEQGHRYASSGTVSCKEPHDIEVFGASETFDSAPKLAYPGLAPLSRYAEGWCSLVFSSDQITMADKDTALHYVAIVPTDKAWQSPGEDKIGARDVYCVLWRKDFSQLTNPVLKERE